MQKTPANDDQFMHRPMQQVRYAMYGMSLLDFLNVLKLVGVRDVWKKCLEPMTEFSLSVGHALFQRNARLRGAMLSPEVLLEIPEVHGFLLNPDPRSYAAFQRFKVGYLLLLVKEQKLVDDLLGVLQRWRQPPATATTNQPAQIGTIPGLQTPQVNNIQPPQPLSWWQRAWNTVQNGVKKSVELTLGMIPEVRIFQYSVAFLRTVTSASVAYATHQQSYQRQLAPVAQPVQPDAVPNIPAQQPSPLRGQTSQSHQVLQALPQPTPLRIYA
ncbi:MAG: hypothetical protein NTW08_06775 [Gammaproteobacteria bacterium]|nr:hypothetical protein [Gammaproteobacteria bacterium]